MSNIMNRYSYTPEKIISLNENEIFVFGSNLAGIHGAGAAFFAMKKFGAIKGVGRGLSGKTYAFPTKDHKIHSRSLKEIGEEISCLYRTALSMPEKIFLVTKVGCGLAGFSEQEIGDLFRNREAEKPSNIGLPIEVS